MVDEKFILSNGVEIPAIGYGTYLTPVGEITYQSVLKALGVGYRHVDTASAYANEADVGQAIIDSGIPRKDIFLTTKHWVDSRGYEKTIAAAEESLKKLKTDYIDLYLVHWPCVAAVTENWEELNAETWRGFERLYKDGKLRSIGVSNYEQKHLEALAKTQEIAPMVNQLEFHPGYLQMDTVEYSKKVGMVVEAYCPLGSGAILDRPELLALAEKYGKSVAQICVRFILQCGVLPLPKSLKEERMISNKDVFDFEIAEEDMKMLLELPQFGFTGWIPEEAPADFNPVD